MKSSITGTIGIPRTISLGLSIALASLAIIALVDSMSITATASAEDWENHANITSISDIRDISINSYDETLAITKGHDIYIWGLNNNTYFKRIYINSEDALFIDMDWSDGQRLFAWAQLIRVAEGDPDLWWSDLVLFDGDGVAVDGYRPYGTLEPYDKQIVTVEWSPTSPHLAVAYRDGMTRIIDTSDGTVALERKNTHDIVQLSWSPNGNLLAIVQNDKRNNTDGISIIDLPNNNSWSFLNTSGIIDDMDWSSDGLSIFFTSGGTLFRVDVGTRIMERIQIGAEPYIASSPTESLLAMFGNKGVTFWDYGSNETEHHYSSRGQKPFGEWTMDGSRSSLPRPTVGISTPLKDSEVFGTINVTGWSRSSREETLHVLIQVDGLNWTETHGTVEWHYILDTTRIPDGLLKLRVRATDIYGVSDVSFIAVEVRNGPPSENDPPIIWIDAPVNGTTAWGILSIHGEASDDNAVIAIQVKIGPLQWESIPITAPAQCVTLIHHHDIFFMEEGELVILFRSFDGVFFSMVETRTLTLEPPMDPMMNLSVQILFPNRGETVPPTFIVSGIVSEGYAEEVFLSIDYPYPHDDKLVHIFTGTKVWSYNLTDLEEGSYAVSAIARNGTVYSDWHSVSFFVVKDIPITNRAPQINITHPENAHNTSTGSLDVRGWSFDDDDVILVEIRINDGEWKTAIGTESWSYEASPEDLVRGWNVLQARAYDGETYGLSDTIIVRFIEDTEPEPHAEGVPEYVSVLVIILVIVIIILVSILLVKISRGKV